MLALKLMFFEVVLKGYNGLNLMHGRGLGHIFIIFHSSLAIVSHEQKKSGRPGRWLEQPPDIANPEYRQFLS